MSELYCIDCKHYVDDAIEGKCCFHPQIAQVKGISLITGVSITDHMPCIDMRNDPIRSSTGLCGTVARLFEPKA